MRINKLTNYLNNNLFNFFLGFLIVLNILPFLAPLLASIGWDVPSKIIYTIYSFFCHQIHWRSIHIEEFQVAWCTRDTFIWGALLMVGLLVKFFRVKGISWYWIFPFVIPIAMDGIIQTIATIFGFGDAAPLYISTNFLRMITGTLFGLGLGLWLLPMLNNIVEEEKLLKENKPLTILTKRSLSNGLVIALVIATMSVCYLGLVQIWYKTSPSYQPANAVDFYVRTPADPNDWIIRRENGL